jgi:hypothetical protein
MANQFRLSQATANVAVDRVCALLNSGRLQLFDGVQPGSPDAPISSQNKLAEFAFGSPAFGPASDGVAQANTIPTASVIQAGTATWFRATRSDGTAVFDGSVGTTGADLNLSSVNLTINAPITISAFSYTQPIS